MRRVAGRARRVSAIAARDVLGAVDFVLVLVVRVVDAQLLAEFGRRRVVGRVRRVSAIVALDAFGAVDSVLVVQLVRLLQPIRGCRS